MMKTQQTLVEKFEELRSSYIQEADRLADGGGYETFDRFQAIIVPSLLEFIKSFTSLLFECLAEGDDQTAFNCTAMIAIMTDKMLYLYEREEA